MRNKLPLYLTLSRIVLTAPIMLLMMDNTAVGRITATVLFIIASITDYWDGYFARKYNAVSDLGKFMDPVADKILVTGVLVILLVSNQVDPWMVMLFVVRDTIVGGVRAAAAAAGVIIAAQTTGKWKAALQFISLPLLIMNDLQPQFKNHQYGYWLLWLSVILSLKSGFDYCLAYRNGLKRQSNS